MKRIDEEKFIQVYDQYAEDIFRYCYFRIYDRERAKELMQEAFTKTWEYLRSGKEVENLRAFLYRSAHNLCVNEAVRSKAYSLEEMQEKAGYDPTDNQTTSPEYDAEMTLLMDRVAQLNSSDREVITLRYVNGLSVSDIAAILGVAPNTVSVRIHRALKELREKSTTQ